MRGVSQRPFYSPSLFDGDILEVTSWRTFQEGLVPMKQMVSRYKRTFASMLKPTFTTNHFEVAVSGVGGGVADGRGPGDGSGSGTHGKECGYCAGCGNLVCGDEPADDGWWCVACVAERQVVEPPTLMPSQPPHVELPDEGASRARNLRDIAKLRKRFSGFCSHHLLYHHGMGRSGCARAPPTKDGCTQGVGRSDAGSGS